MRFRSSATRLTLIYWLCQIVVFYCFFKTPTDSPKKKKNRRYGYPSPYRRSYISSYSLRQMQQIDQNDPGQSIIGDYGDQIVYGCDQRTGCHSRIHPDLLEEDRNNCAE